MGASGGSWIGPVERAAGPPVLAPVESPGPDGYQPRVLHGRAAERAAIQEVLDGARGSRGGALVLRGDPGVGKSALLADAVADAADVRGLVSRGVESESPLAFAALQRLLGPLTPLLGRLPAPQAEALRAALGGRGGAAGDPDDRFLVFLATLSLLAEAGQDGPVLAVVDDAHWLDESSAAALLFAARRLADEPVAMLFAARDGDPRRFDSGDLPVLAVHGLGTADAAALLREAADPVAPVVADALVAATAGNPLALVEVPAGLTTAQRRGEEPLPAALPVTAEVERAFLDRARPLDDAAWTWLLVAAVDDSGREGTVRRAAAALGVPEGAAEAVEWSGLLRLRDGTVELRHPLVRSAVHAAATGAALRRVHRALADALGEEGETDRRAWHLAAATDPPDDDVARLLDEVGARAARRGGQEAAAAALARAGEIGPAGDARAARCYAAARAAWLAGQAARARGLADTALAEVHEALLRADVARLRARVEWNVGSAPAAHGQVLRAAAEIADRDPDRAREMAMFGAAVASFGGDSGVALDPTALVPPVADDDTPRRRCFDLLLRGLVHLTAGNVAYGGPELRRALELSPLLGPEDQDLLPNLGIAALHLHDDPAVERLHDALLARARGTGAIVMVIYALTRRAFAELTTGRWSRARASAAEASTVAANTGLPALTALPRALLALLAALRGEPEADALLAEAERAAEGPSGLLEVLVRDVLHRTRALAPGRSPEAAVHHLDLITLPLLRRVAAVDRLEAGVRAGRRDAVAAEIDELETVAAATGARALAAAASHGRGLLAGGDEARGHFERALAEHAACPRRFDRARTELALGEHLRRTRRRVDARAHLRAAADTFADLGAQRWLDRAQQELRASGETARRGPRAPTHELTPQEAQVAGLVAEGLSTRDAAARLYLSPRTVDFHLRNVFTKLGVSSRRELTRAALEPGEPQPVRVPLV
jgi:DNA-binding CsgD family transcriptional regulator